MTCYHPDLGSAPDWSWHVGNSQIWGSDASSVQNFCARSQTSLAGKPVVVLPNVGCFLMLCKLQHQKHLKIGFHQSNATDISYWYQFFGLVFYCAQEEHVKQGRLPATVREMSPQSSLEETAGLMGLLLLISTSQIVACSNRTGSRFQMVDTKVLFDVRCNLVIERLSLKP